MYTKRFFTLGSEIPRPKEITFLTVLLFFIYWIFIQNLLLPVLLYFLTPLISHYASLQGTRLTLLSVNQWGYTLLLIAGFLILHFRLKQQLRQNILLRHKSFIRLFRDIGFSFLVLIIALPTVSFIDGSFEYILSKVVQTSVPNQIAIQYLLAAREQIFSYITMIVTAVIFAPIIEEYLFRGLLQTYLRTIFGPKGSILLSSLVFSLFHFSLYQGIGNIPLLISLFIFALYLGFCYEKRESLLSPIVLHMAFNATTVIRIHFFEG